MDGNFIDNNFDSIIESAVILSQRHEGSGNTEPEDVQNKYDEFTLRIQFNKNLDPNSVNSENAALVTGNKKVNTDINYDKSKKSIIIKPNSRYLRNKLYILKISGKLMTEKGRSLRKHLFFAFKHNGSKLSFYKGLMGEIGTAPVRLPIKRSYMLHLLFAFSALILVCSYLYDNNIGMVAGTLAVLVAVIFAMLDSLSGYGKSHKEYIYGAKLYNQGFYYEALECFERALHHDPTNEYAKHALDAAIIKSLEGE